MGDGVPKCYRIKRRALRGDCFMFSSKRRPAAEAAGLADLLAALYWLAAVWVVAVAGVPFPAGTAEGRTPSAAATSSFSSAWWVLTEPTAGLALSSRP